MTADLDTLLTALYVELTDRIIPFREPGRRGPGRPPEVTDAELACLAVAQVLLRCDGERHWLRAAPRLAGPLLPAAAGPERVQHPAAAARAADGSRPALARRRHPGDRLRVLRESFPLVLGMQAAADRRASASVPSGAGAGTRSVRP